ncbi:hypothetical protein [Algoriphagus mannitolivorans]|uniref:hypothetical protein n=1 Tax=Algoriphagus mannitolivorans TaxID=226504 RepID=UPI0003FAC277|nr:hypothetical protein [Algoriphagus mannitolivorans]
MEKLTNDQMENLVGGNDYCQNMWTILSGGQFQGSNELLEMAVQYFDQYCSDWTPPSSGTP